MTHKQLVPGKFAPTALSTRDEEKFAIENALTGHWFPPRDTPCPQGRRREKDPRLPLLFRPPAPAGGGFGV